MVKKTSPIMYAIGLTLIVLVVIGVYGVLQTQTGESAEVTSKELGDCETAPSIADSVVNADKLGTSVSGYSIQARVNGDYIGSIATSSKTFKRGDRVELLFNVSNYISSLYPEVIEMECGSNSIQHKLYATSTNSFRMFNENGALLADTDNGNSTNQTYDSSQIVIDVKIDSTVDESTGDLIIVVETNDTEVDEIAFSGFGGATKVDVPEFYAEQFGGSSLIKAFAVPALLDGITADGTLQLTAESGKTIGSLTEPTPVYVTAYSKQAFVDTDGTFKVGVEDSDGTAKYEDTWDFDFSIGA